MSELSFHPTYADLLRGLPPSQLKEARRRLCSCKQPLTDEELVSEHPRVLACLEKIAASYGRKKGRSAVASKARRDAARGQTTVSSTELNGDGDSVEPVIASIEGCTLEPVEIVCGEDEEPEDAVSSTELNGAEDENFPPPLALRRESTEAVALKPLAKPPSPAKPTTAAPHAAPSLAEQLGKNKAPPPPPTQSKGRKFFTNQQ
jgi:hypothetical protein